MRFALPSLANRLFPPQFTGYIDIQDIRGASLCKKQMQSAQEIVATTARLSVSNEYEQSKAIFIPIRTSVLADFFEDLFFPSFNFALRVSKTALSILDRCGAWLLRVSCLALDMVTFPIRLMTALPRVIYNRCAPKSAVLRWIEENGQQMTERQKQALQTALKAHELCVVSYYRKPVSKGFETRAESIWVTLKPDPELSFAKRASSAVTSLF